MITLRVSVAASSTIMLKLLVALFFLNCLISFVEPQSDDDFIFSKGPVPNRFIRGQRYPDRDEEVECQPIRLRVARGSKTFQQLITYAGSKILFKTQNSRIMSSRLHAKLTELSNLYFQQFRVKLYVLKAWTEYNDYEVTERSLHYEGLHYSSSVKMKKKKCSTELL